MLCGFYNKNTPPPPGAIELRTIIWRQVLHYSEIVILSPKPNVGETHAQALTAVTHDRFLNQKLLEMFVEHDDRAGPHRQFPTESPPPLLKNIELLSIIIVIG